MDLFIWFMLFLKKITILLRSLLISCKSLPWSAGFCLAWPWRMILVKLYFSLFTCFFLWFCLIEYLSCEWMQYTTRRMRQFNSVSIFSMLECYSHCVGHRLSVVELIGGLWSWSEWGNLKFGKVVMNYRIMCMYCFHVPDCVVWCTINWAHIYVWPSWLVEPNFLP